MPIDQRNEQSAAQLAVELLQKARWKDGGGGWSGITLGLLHLELFGSD